MILFDCYDIRLLSVAFALHAFYVSYSVAFAFFLVAFIFLTFGYGYLTGGFNRSSNLVTVLVT